MTGEAFPNDPHQRAVIYTGILDSYNLHFAVDQLGDLVEITVGNLHVLYSTAELLKIGGQKEFIGGIESVIGFMVYEPQNPDENWRRPFDEELRAVQETE